MLWKLAKKFTKNGFQIRLGRVVLLGEAPKSRVHFQLHTISDGVPSLTYVLQPSSG